MSIFPVISGRELMKALLRIGYQMIRQRGSHIRLLHTVKKPLTVPDHRVLGKGLLRKILRDAGLSLEELIKLLKK